MSRRPRRCSLCGASSVGAYWRPDHSQHWPPVTCVCGEDLTVQVRRKSETTRKPPPNVVASCSRGHHVQVWRRDLQRSDGAA